METETKRETFTMKWGTPDPIRLDDPDMGVVQVRGYGNCTVEVEGGEKLPTDDDLKKRVRDVLLACFAQYLEKTYRSVPDIDRIKGNEGVDVIPDLANPALAPMGLEVTGFEIEGVAFTEETLSRIKQHPSLHSFAPEDQPIIDGPQADPFLVNRLMRMAARQIPYIPEGYYRELLLRRLEKDEVKADEHTREAFASVMDALQKERAEEVVMVFFSVEDGKVLPGQAAHFLDALREALEDAGLPAEPDLEPLTGVVIRGGEQDTTRRLKLALPVIPFVLGHGSFIKLEAAWAWLKENARPK